jgi:MoaA/NifB/PqqE/SkfB family radical SAM enzyme
MVHHAKTGLFLREDTNLGLLVYSPFTGLIFSCLEDDGAFKKNLVRWLRGDAGAMPSEVHTRSVGVGWHVPMAEARYPSTQLLSVSGRKWKAKKPDYPLVINWLITGRCSCRCRYCYAADLMEREGPEPDPTRVRKVAETILSYQPLVVVLTGGDPMTSPSLKQAMVVLHGRTGIIVDTNGIGLTPEHVQLFKKYKVFVRVSLDSESPKKNNKLRPIKNGRGCSLDAALDCVSLCLTNGIQVGIQTVVTKENASDLEALGHKLHRSGVTSWRLQILANHARFRDYSALRPNIGRFSRNILHAIDQKSRTGWDEAMSVQVSDNSVPNAVVLVSPDGEFFTEVEGFGKEAIDPKHVCRPTLSAVRSGSLNLDAHTQRYLGMLARRR